MPTLSQLTGETRTIFKWLGILLGAILIFFIVISIKNAIFPPPPPKPTVSFGKLDAELLPDEKKLNYSLNTLTGSLPSLPKTERVYKMTEAQADLLALPRAQDKVRRVGFEDKPTKISENIYQWIDQTTQRTLTMNILDNNFSMFSNFLSNNNSPIFDNDVNSAVTTAKEFLDTMGVLPQDVDLTKTQAGLYSIKNFSIIPSDSLSTTQIIKVSFFQKSFNGYEIYYPNSNISPLNLLVGSVKGNPQIVEANYFYQKPSDIFSTYPLKTPNQAFTDLKNGKGYVSSYSGTTGKVSIKKVSLGYYISEKRQRYLIPIIVFQGDDFTAYVPAVTDEWVNK